MFSWVPTVLTYLAPPILAAALSGYAVHRWKGRSEYIDKRLDELCEVVADTAGIASD